MLNLNIYKSSNLKRLIRVKYYTWNASLLLIKSKLGRERKLYIFSCMNKITLN